MSIPEYGVFADFWNGQPNHLPLLNLFDPPNLPAEWSLTKSLDRLDSILSTKSAKSVRQGIHLLLKSDNWRPHLVAAVAILKVGKEEKTKLKGTLWKRLNQGSWVTPQILVVLSMIDDEFVELARDIRVKGYAKGPVNLPSLTDHLAKGPVELTVQQSKTMAAAEYLVSGVLVDTDENDQGASHAKHWKSSLLGLIDAGKFKLPDDGSSLFL